MKKTRIVCAFAIFLTYFLPPLACVAQIYHSHHKPKYNIPITGKYVPKMTAFDHTFVKFLQQWKIPGAAVAIMKNGRLVFARGYGWADIEHQKPVEPNSLFRIASVSKLITAVTILYLVQQHKLNLNDKVFNILNNLKPLSQKRVSPTIHTITVKNLLFMSSGWSSRRLGFFDPMFGPWPSLFIRILGTKPPASCENTARVMMNMPFRFKPGSHFSYSNLDYCLLGLIINKVTNHSYGAWGYAQYIRNHILAPLHIYNMQIGSTEFRNRAPGEVLYYRYPLMPKYAEGFRPATYLPYSDTEILKKNFSDGGWIASTVDLAQFVSALANHHILNRHMLNIMKSKPPYLNHKTQNYFAMGWKTKLIHGSRYWIATGSFTGTNAYVLLKPNHTVIAVLFNARAPSSSHFKRFRPNLRRLLLSRKVAF